MLYFTKTYTISDVESMNRGKLNRTMKCNLCKKIDKLSQIKRVDLSQLTAENYLITSRRKK